MSRLNRTTRRLGIAALLLSSLALEPAQAQSPPAPARLLQSVKAGFDGGASRDHPTPVWVTLVNQGDRQASFTLVGVSGQARTQRAVDLPAGGRRRVCLALRIRGEVLVQLLQDGEVLERKKIEAITGLDPKRHLLSIDGRPEDRRTAAGSRRTDPSLYVSAIDQSQAPTEAVCYEAFGAVLLRGVDPDAWDRDQRSAVLEYAAQGGTLILDEVKPGRVEQVGLLRLLGVKAKSTKVLSQSAQQFSYGLGRVLTFRDDILKTALQAGAKSAQAKQDLGDLVQRGRGKVKFAPTFQTYNGRFPDHPASGSQALVGGFLLIYLLAIGPVLAFALRKSSRKKLALTAAIGVAGFSLLAFLVAGLVRVGAGVAFVNEVVYVPKNGLALHVSDITVVSGGASSYRLELTGMEQVAATVLPSETGQFVNRWHQRETTRFRGSRTLRGTELAVDLAMPLWGQQSVETLSVIPKVRPLSAELRLVGRSYEVRIVNTTGAPIEQALVMELGIGLNKYTGYTELGRLDPGQEKVVKVTRNARLRAPPKTIDDLTWYSKLGVPEDWHGWTKIRPARRKGGSAALDFAVVSVIPSRFQTRGKNLRTRHHTLRIDPVDVAAGLDRGYMGIVLEAGNKFAGQDWVQARVGRVLPNGPAAKAGVTVGMMIVTLENAQVTSPQQLREAVARRLPGEAVRLGLSDPTTGQFRNVRIRLGSRAEVPTGD